MFQVARSRDSRLQEQSSKILRSTFLMTVFRHLIIDAILRRELSKKTKEAAVIIVAQRISTILHAEQIIVLDEGKVAGIGTHQELFDHCAVYREIAESQLSEADIAKLKAQGKEVM